MPLLIDEKIDRAGALLRVYRDALLTDGETGDLLADLGAKARFLAALMVEFLIPSICVRCGSGPRGGCCSPEMGDDCDSLLVLMNLLAGCDVSVQRRDGIECHFLGPAGCILLFKPFFCLNYNCRKIQDALAKDSMSAIEMHTGRLLCRQHLLEQQLRDFFRLRKVAIPA